MKNYFLYTAVACIGALIIFTAFKKESAEVEQQKQEIQLAVEENLAIFAEEKEEECREKALKAAILRVQNMEKEKAAAIPEEKPELPATSKPKPVAPANTTSSTPPPVPPPTTDAEPVPTEPVPSEPEPTPASPTVETPPADPSTGTNVGKKVPPTDDPVEKAKSGVNKGKKGRKSGGN